YFPEGAVYTANLRPTLRSQRGIQLPPPYVTRRVPAQPSKNITFMLEHSQSARGRSYFSTILLHNFHVFPCFRRPIYEVTLSGFGFFFIFASIRRFVVVRRVRWVGKCTQPRK